MPTPCRSRVGAVFGRYVPFSDRLPGYDPGGSHRQLEVLRVIRRAADRVRRNAFQRHRWSIFNLTSSSTEAEVIAIVTAVCVEKSV